MTVTQEQIEAYKDRESKDAFWKDLNRKMCAEENIEKKIALEIQTETALTAWAKANTRYKNLIERAAA